VLPSLLPLLTDALDTTAPGSVISGSPLDGTFLATWHHVGNDKAFLDRVRRIVVEFGGRAVVHYCHPDLKRRIDVFGDVPPKTLELMRRIKQQFDPNGILSPGRFVGRI
jgi:FAD/FMN-containing dehydrogenase